MHWTSEDHRLADKWSWKLSHRLYEAVDGNLNPLPWYPYSFIEFINQQDLSDKMLLEWGAGASTVWWSNRVKEVHAIEHNQMWYDYYSRALPETAQIHLVFKDYDTYPLKIGKLFDIIVLDGMHRNACFDVALKLLKPNGILVLDDADRVELCNIDDCMVKMGFDCDYFRNLAPIYDKLAACNWYSREVKVENKA